MRLAAIFAVVVALAAAPGCALDDPPEVPSWQVDVMPVLAANCVRCHGFPLNPVARNDFRLDAYSPTLLPGETIPIDGAGGPGLASQIATFTRPGFSVSLKVRMPPDRTLADREYLILRNWAGAADAVTESGPRGPGRFDNRAPTVTSFEEVARVGRKVTFAFEVSDLDHDLVSGVVIGPTLDVQMQVQPGNIGILVSGRRTFEWDTTGLPEGSYDLTARLDDGADIDGPDGEEDYIDVPVMTVVIP